MAGQPQNSENKACPNCGYNIDRDFCSNCGQHKSNHNAGVWQFVQEFLAEFVQIDSKLLRTLVPLITKPGYLTRQWAEGKRVRYISPLKLYISISALFFLVVNLSATSVTTGHHQQVGLDAFINRALPNLPQVDPATFRVHFFSHLPTASLLLIPLTGLVFWLLYFRQKRFYVEHLVFVLHYNTFCFLTLGIATLFKSPILSLAAVLWATVYLLFAIKTNYAQGWGKTILKYSLFTAIHVSMILLATLATVEVSAYMASIGIRQPTHTHHEP